MGASTRPKHGKRQLGKGNSENQSRANRPINRATRRSSVSTPKQRGVLTDLTNSFKLSSRDPSAKGDAHEAGNMKDKPIATPIRVSTRISAAKTQKEEPVPNTTKSNKRKVKSTKVTTENDEDKNVEQTEHQAKGKDKLQAPDLIDETNRQPDVNNSDQDEDYTKKVKKGRFAEKNPLTSKTEKVVRPSRSKKTNQEMCEKSLIVGKNLSSEVEPSTAEPQDAEDQQGRRKSVRQSNRKIAEELLKEGATQSIKGRTSRSGTARTKNSGHELSRNFAKQNVDAPGPSMILKKNARTCSTKQTPKGKAKENLSRVEATKKTQTKMSAMKSSPKQSPARTGRSSPQKTVDNKKIPIYKSEPKPDTLQPAEDDIYDFGYDPKDVKQKKKRQKRPKNASPVRNVKKRRVEPENLPPIELKLPEELEEKLKVAQKTPWQAPSPTIIVQLPQSPAFYQMDQSLPGPLVSRLPASTPLISSTPYVSSHRSMPYNAITPMAEMAIGIDSVGKAAESVVSIGATEQTSGQEISKPTLPPLTIENCFGFDEPEEESQSIEPRIMRTTPIKPPAAAPFRPFASPVRKNLNRISAGSRPARLEVSRDAMALKPVAVPQEKTKQPTLAEYIQDIGTMDRSIEEDKRGFCPPTPPTVFRAPPRRSYSKQEMHQVKRAMFKEHIEAEMDDNESTEEHDENDDWNKPKKKTVKRRPKKNKLDKEADEWAKMMTAHFDDIEKSGLIVSD